MKRYIITQPKEQGIYDLGDDNFIQIYIKDILTNQLSDPSNVSISVTNPYGTLMVDHDPMSSSATGIYTYDFSIPTSATPGGYYGKWEVQVETTGYDSLYDYTFVVFPWNVINRVRGLSGAYQQNDISDEKLALIAWKAYMQTLDRIYELRHLQSLKCNCNSKYPNIFNGVNQDFQLKDYPLADHNGDNQVTGYGQLSAGWDVDFYYIDSTGAYKHGIVMVQDAKWGIVKLLDSNGNAIPADICDAYVTYWSEAVTFDFDLMHEAVAYLTAYKIWIAFKSLDKATLSDLQSNRALDGNKFYERYTELVEMIGFPIIGSGK